MKKTNLILIGMPASGKSTVGVILAKVLGYGFIDTDILIQRAQKKRLAQIIKEVGVDGFLEVENRVNASVEADHCVIATGGSAVYGEDAMRHFKEIGHIMYLKTDFETIRKKGAIEAIGQRFGVSTIIGHEQRKRHLGIVLFRFYDGAYGKTVEVSISPDNEVRHAIFRDMTLNSLKQPIIYALRRIPMPDKEAGFHVNRLV